jgi:hypothetical protein
MVLANFDTVGSFKLKKSHCPWKTINTPNELGSVGVPLSFLTIIEKPTTNMIKKLLAPMLASSLTLQEPFNSNS